MGRGEEGWRRGRKEGEEVRRRRRLGGGGGLNGEGGGRMEEREEASRRPAGGSEEGKHGRKVEARKRRGVCDVASFLFIHCACIPLIR